MSSIASVFAHTAPATTPPSSSSTTTDPGDPLANESTFLTLLVSQLQNQDPENPPDSSQFITQLTGYSQLEQMININQNTSTLVTDAAGTSSTTGSGTGSGSDVTTNTTNNANSITGNL
jgi:flagellar basal-body rod modification protein FlgD